MSLLYSERRVGGGFLFYGGLAATIVVHGAILTSVFVGRTHAQASQGPMIGKVIDVEAVKFGKPRDMSFLPHKEAPPPPRPKPKLELSENEKALPHLKDPDEDKDHRPVEDDLLKRTHARDFEKLADAENTGSAAPEGDPNGQKGGTATVGKGPIYLQHLVAAIQNAWVVPTTIADRDLARLKAQACIKIDATGKVTEYKLSAPSGNDRYDATLLDALGSIKQFDPPTADVKVIVMGEGVCLNFQKDRT